MRLIQKLRGFDSYIIELTVIITGILLALAADASWDYRQDRKQERDVIKALVIEFQKDAEELLEDQSRRLAKIGNFEALTNFSDNLTSPQKADALQSLLGYRFYAPNHAILDDILSTGRLSLIRSDKIRELIMTFEHERETQIIMESASLDNSSIVMRNYLATKMDFLALNSTDTNRNYYLKNSGQEHIAQILDDKNFRSLLYLSFRRTRGIHRHADILLNIVYELQKELKGNIT